MSVGGIAGKSIADKARADTSLSPRRRERLVALATDAVLLAVCLVMLLPLVLLVSNAFKTPPDILKWPPAIFPRDATLDNFRAVLTTTPLLRWLMNSALFATLSTAAILVTSAISGYVFAKFRSMPLDIIFGVILATAIVPFEVYMIPLYFNVQALGPAQQHVGAAHRLSRDELRDLPHPPERDRVDPRRTARGRAGRRRRGDLDLRAHRRAAAARTLGGARSARVLPGVDCVYLAADRGDHQES